MQRLNVAAHGADSVGDAPSPSALRAEIHPPIGVCTGDYSKFEELKGRLNAPSPASSSAGQAEPLPIPTDQAALTGIVTEQQLREAMQRDAQGVALIAADARLTPLANDLAREKPQQVKRMGQSADARQMHTRAANPTGSALPWLIWCDGRCPAVDLIQQRYAAQLRRTAARTDPAAVSNLALDLAGLVRSGQVAGGLLFVATAARAMCFANRCRSLRAVLGTCDEAVQQGIDELGANVLVVEYPHVGRRMMIAMVERMMAQRPRTEPAVQRILAQLERCE